MSDPRKPIRVRQHQRHVRRRREFEYDPETGRIIEAEEPAEPEVRQRVERIPPGFRYDPKRGEYVHEVTGEVLEARGEAEAPAAPVIYRELPRGQHATRKDILRMASRDLTALGYRVGRAEDERSAFIERGGSPEFPTLAETARSGTAPDHDILNEVEVLRRRVGPTDRVNRRGVAAALVIVALARTRQRMVTPTELVDLENPDRDQLRDDVQTVPETPDDEASVAYTKETTQALDAEEAAIRAALRIVRERLREREARPRPGSVLGPLSSRR